MRIYDLALNLARPEMPLSTGLHRVSRVEDQQVPVIVLVMLCKNI